MKELKCLAPRIRRIRNGGQEGRERIRLCLLGVHHQYFGRPNWGRIFKGCKARAGERRGESSSSSSLRSLSRAEAQHSGEHVGVFLCGSPIIGEELSRQSCSTEEKRREQSKLYFLLHVFPGLKHSDPPEHSRGADKESEQGTAEQRELFMSLRNRARFSFFKARQACLASKSINHTSVRSTSDRSQGRGKQKAQRAGGSVTPAGGAGAAEKRRLAVALAVALAGAESMDSRTYVHVTLSH